MSTGSDGLAELHGYLRTRGVGPYLGLGGGRLAFAPAQHAALVLGPPRSGKTSTLAVPNVLAAPGAVVSTSTKADVLAATVAERSRLGRCWLLDPTGTVTVPPGVTPIRWSPVEACRSWDEALVTVHAMVWAARPASSTGEGNHWTERAEALLAPLFHAAAVGEQGMEAVVHWVLRQDLDTPRAGLAARGAPLAADVLAGLSATDGRELSGIWSTAAGVLAAYRSEAALRTALAPNFDPRSFPASSDTVYVCAPARHQAVAAPIVVAFLEQLRAGAYARFAATSVPTPVVLVLDELANVAPLPDLPSLVSEGGGQGVVTVACLQDLSQARQRWGAAADGFLSLFGTKVVLGGIADLPTLELVSRLAGEVDLPARSVSRGSWWSPGHGSPTTTWSTRRQRRLPVDTVNQLRAGTGLVLAGNQAPTWVSLRPWWEVAPFAPSRPPPRPEPPRRPAAAARGTPRPGRAF